MKTSTTATPINRKLRIALVADPYLPVPPRHYGGIERVIDFLAEGLQKRGHSVTLWGHPASEVDCEFVPYGSPPHRGATHRLRELWQVGSSLVPRLKDFDLVHSFGRLAAMLPVLPSSVPVVQSYQREITPRSITWGSRLGGGSLMFTACSTNCRLPVSHTGKWATVYNGVRLSDYTFRPHVSADAPLVFLGRIERIKGVHTAIEIARRAGRRLVIAGNLSDEPEHQEYFNRRVRPHFDDDRVVCVGPVNDSEKNILLGGAAALLMPIEWEEPFGIVMAEAMACGTPVIGTRRGAVPEVVDHGVTGFVCNTVDEMVEAVPQIPDILRLAVRARCEALFSDDAIVEAYEALYFDHLTRCR